MNMNMNRGTGTGVTTSMTVAFIEQAGMLRLMQLSSSVFPIGAFAYSQGLENAIEQGWIPDEPSLLDWLSGLGEHTVARLDLPLLLQAHRAWQLDDDLGALQVGERLLANRESRELREQELQLGQAFRAALSTLRVPEAKVVAGHPGAGYVVMYALGAAHFGIAAEQAALGFAYAWSEQQANAAARLVPLGHMATQRVLSSLLGVIPGWVAVALALADEDIGNVAPALALSSAWHETQYTRLFRS
jgi:urease accessory protein